MSPDRSRISYVGSTARLFVAAITVVVVSSTTHAQSPEPRGSGGAPRGADGNPSFGISNPDAASFLMVPPDEDGMFYMLNLQKFRDKAVYHDGRETNLTGEDADKLYDPMPEIRKVGGGLVYAGRLEAQLAGKDPTWDSVAIVMYPSRAKLMEMSTSAAFRKTAEHKGASLGASQIIVTVPEEAWTFSEKPPLPAGEIPHRASSDDPAFTLFHLVKYRDVAEYPDGSNEPKRSGREAMNLFWSSVAGFLREAGVTPMLKAEVDGVVVGDGREWDDYRMLRFPSHRAYQEVLAKIEASDFAYHFSAAIEDEYRLQLQDQFDLTANPPTPGNVSAAGPIPSPEMAPQIIATLDTDDDGKISKSEADAGLQKDFAFIDSNGDGGIDLEELTKLLKVVAAQRGSR